MDKDQAKKAQEASNRLQSKITTQWRNFANQLGREAYEDLLAYIDTQMEMYIQYGSELQMPSPTGKGKVPIDLTTAAILLQNRRGMGIVKTYITSRVNQGDVVQPKISK